MNERHVNHIDVGMYDGKAGITLHYEDGTKHHLLFSVAVAEQIISQLSYVCHDLRYADRQFSTPGDSVRVSESVKVHLTTPKEDTHETPGSDTLSISG